MRAVEDSCADNSAVEMDQWFSAFAFPTGETPSGFLVVLADDMIANRIKAVFIGGHCLVGFGAGIRRISSLRSCCSPAVSAMAAAGM